MKTRSNYCLVILTTHFGTNFSGGSTATCEIFSRIENEFSEIIVVGTQLGKHPFSSIQFLRYQNWLQALVILNRLKSKKAIFYGDFYNAFLFIVLNIPFFFTYHDNWPEQSKVSFKNKLLALFYVPVYISIFKKAKLVFTVSEFKYQYIRQFSRKVELVYNGFNHKRDPGGIEIVPKKSVLMVGNVDSRKYKLALELFQLLKEKKQEVTIDIYGNVNDDELAQKLQSFQFVELKGYHIEVPYQNYRLLLHTSIIENLPIVFCEAIYYKIPIIAFDVGGSNELIVDSVNGLLVKHYDIQKMAAALYKLLTGQIDIKIDKAVLKKRSWKYAAQKYSEHIFQ